MDDMFREPIISGVIPIQVNPGKEKRTVLSLESAIAVG